MSIESKSDKLKIQKKKIRKNNMKKIMATTLASSIVLQSTTNVFADELIFKDNELSNINVEVKEDKDTNDDKTVEKENNIDVNSKDENSTASENKKVEVKEESKINKSTEKERTNTVNSNSENSNDNEAKTDKEITNKPLTEDDKNKDNIKNTEYTDESAFTFSNGTITGYNKYKGGYDVKIPPTIKGEPVTAIGYEAFYFKDLKSVEIPDSVKSIGDRAFCVNNLESVEIPSSVTSIGENAFASNDLESVKIPSSITAIKDKTFEHNRLKSIEIPSSVTSIGEYAFASNNLESIEIPDSVTLIDDEAFADNKLTSIKFPEGMKSIGFGVFASNNLESIEIPDTVTNIGQGAFMDNRLKSVKIPDSVTCIESYAFWMNELTSVEIPNSVTNIDMGAFEENKLTSVKFSDGLKSIGESAFNTNKLTNLEIPNSVTFIGYDAFENNELTSVKLSNNLKTIRSRAFENNKLTSLEIPNSVTTIEYDIMNNQSSEIKIRKYGDEYHAILKKLDPNIDPKRVKDIKTDCESFTYDENTGVIIFPSFPKSISYNYEVGNDTVTGKGESIVNLSTTEAKKGKVNYFIDDKLEKSEDEFLDDTINSPDITPKKGYTLSNWYKDKELSTKWDFTNDELTASNTDLYAKWIANEYTVKFDANDGTKQSMENQTFTYDKSGKLNKNTFTRQGYKFKGWSTTPDGEVEYADEAEVLNLAESGTVTLYAQWAKTLEPINMAPIITAEDKVLTVGDKFNPLEGVKATDKEDGDIHLTEDNIISNNVDMKQAGTYNITYKVTDSKGASSIKTITVTVNPKMESINSIPTITAKDKVLTVGDKFDPLEGVKANDKEDGAITLTEENIIDNNVDMKQAGTYNVTYKVTDSKGASSIKTITVTVNPKIELINSVPTITAEDKVLTVGDSFDPLEGVKANDKEDGAITLTEENIISNNVNMKQAGTYNVTYKVTDKNGASSIKTITVIVNPKMELINSIPTITANDKVLTVGDEFNPLAGVTAYDEEDGDITENIEIIENTVDMGQAGTYTITYKVTDSKGASTIKAINVEVVNNNIIDEPENPEEDNNNTVNKPEDSQENNQTIVDNNNNSNNNDNNNNNTSINSSHNTNKDTSIPETGDAGVLGSAWIGLTALIGLIFNNKKKKK